jgi:hypothetical protein
MRMTNHVLNRLATALLVLGTAVPAMFAQNTILGVLEDVPGVYAGDANSRQVRVVFQKNGTEWQAFPSDCPDQECLAKLTSAYPQEVTWVVAFNGKNLGRITSRTPKDFGLYSHVGLQQLLSEKSVPTVGQRSVKYGGYSHIPLYRPLMAISQPYFKDPESWKPIQASAELVRVLRQEFRRKFPKLCRTSQDETRAAPFPYRANQIKVIKAYGSKTGWAIAQLHLAGAINCADTEAGFEMNDPWFAITPQKSVQHLDQGMWLVDAGDYDNDGKSELVFSIDRNNRGGYELFYDDFKKHKVFEFTYH